MDDLNEFFNFTFFERTEKVQMDESKPCFSIPKESEDPKHPLHELYEMLEMNREYRNNIKPMKEEKQSIKPLITTKLYKTIPSSGKDFVLPEKFKLEYGKLFEEHRQLVTKLKLNLKTTTKTFKFNKTILFNQQPTLDDVITIDNDSLYNGILLCNELSGTSYQYNENFCLWLYGLLLCIDKPFDSELLSTLRSLLISFCRARHSIVCY